jgi:aryl-alcohol dehydrogenase-like predicted oxidoreductase
VGSYEARIDKEITLRVEKIANDKGVSMAKVATAWVLSKGCAPILGLNSVNRIDEAVQSLKVKLSDEEVKYLEEPYAPKRVTGIDPGLPE